MSQLIQMRRRIRAIETIQKITHAMQLISMSTHLRLRDKKNKLEDYQKTLLRLFFSIKMRVPDWKNSLFFPDQDHENTLIILVGSQKGLCGIFNANIAHDFEKDIHKKKIKGSLITVGKKISEYLSVKLQPVSMPLHHIASYDELSWSSLKTLVPQLIDAIVHADKPYTKVLVYSNYPSGFFSQQPRVTQLIPFSSDDIQGEPAEQKQLDYVWEDSPHNLLDELAQQQLHASLYALLVQSLLAEQAARFISMDNATRSANNLKDAMRLQYNKLRQAKITKELTELSSSFEPFHG